MNIAADLHGHTIFSDGRVPPEAFVEERRRHGIRVMAVTDHDVFSAVRRVDEYARRAGMVTVAAAEITAHVNFATPRAEQFHVLAYFPASALERGVLERSFLFRRSLRVLEAWKAFVLEWLLRQPAHHRLAIDPENELESLRPEAFPALQPMIARVASVGLDVFVNFRDHHVTFWDDRELFGWSPEEAIEAIRADGAFDIVAHPGRYRDHERTDAVVRMASGFEVTPMQRLAHQPSSPYSPDDAVALGKVWSAGSNDHQGAHYSSAGLTMPVNFIERILRAGVPIDMVLTG